MKLLIVDDHPLIRKGLSMVLSNENDIERISEASDMEQALRHLKLDAPDVAIVDLRLGSESGLDLIHNARKTNTVTKFIILTSSMRKEDLIRAKESGVDGYILKDAFSEDILYALRVVARGKKYIDPDILRLEGNAGDSSGISQLTQRERDILTALGKGLSNQQIAENLFISGNTVKKHVSSLLAKLGMEHRTQAALYASNLLN